MAKTQKKKSNEPSQEEMDEILAEAALQYQTQTAAIYLRFKQIAREVFDAQTISRELLNKLADCCDLPIDDQGDIDEDVIRALRHDLTAAKAWALEVYGEESPEAVLDAYERGVDMSVEEDDEDFDDDEDNEDDA